VRWFADTQFDAVLYCGDCKLPTPPSAAAVQSAAATEAVTSFAAVRPLSGSCLLDARPMR
jgi:hypothetical protein